MRPCPRWFIRRVVNMEIVLTHNNMDFDSLAAQYAVTKLFPGTRMLPGYPLVGNVREFFALYRDSLPLSQLKYIDAKNIKHIYIVDCQHLDRLDESARKLISRKDNPVGYTIFDHHHIDPEGLGPNARGDSIVKAVGATTTVLVDEIRKRGIKLTPFEATLLLIGIYEDTGCLTYSGTTALDASCVAYLLEQGGDMARVNDYLNPKQSEEQVKLLEDLINNRRVVHVSGMKAVIAWSQRTRYLEGLATLTRKLVEIESADAVVTVVKMRDRIHLVGRSDTQSIDVRQIVLQFGGDGHPGAGSAVSRKTSIEEVINEVEELIKKQVKPEKTAAEIMQAPVRSVRPRVTMEEASRIMLRYGLDGLVVTEGNEVVGVVSRRDIDQALHHKLGHAPVQGFMSRPVLVIRPDTPLSEIQHIMVHEDIGKLPVLDANEQLIGIVTRHEVLRTLYGSQVEEEQEHFALPQKRYGHYRDRLNILSESTLWLFEELGRQAALLNMTAYAVGGCVRDLFLGLPNLDLDFVVEGSAIDLAKALEIAYPGRLQLVAKHDRFQTATMIFNAEHKLEIDISTARTEFYEFPAALPTVEASGLEQDLYRRDFTINALAVCLNPGQFGDVIDYFGGLEDLEARLVRILHPFSFIEDPTRLVRAARFAARLGFELGDKTCRQAERAINMGIFDNLGGARMRTELQLILESKDRLKALDLLGRLGGRLRYLDAHLGYDVDIRRLLRRAERLLAHYRVENNWTVYLGVLLAQLGPSQATEAMERLQIGNQDISDISRGLVLAEELNSVSSELKRSEIYELFKGQSDQSLAIAACLATPGSPLRRIVKLYLEQLKPIELSVSGADLIAMGVQQGPQIGEVLKSVLAAKLNGQISGADDEIAFVKAQLGQALR